MRHHLFENSDSYPIAILAKGTAFARHELLANYVTPLNLQGVATQDVIAFTLEVEPNKKTSSAGFMKDYLAQLLPELHGLGTKYLYVTDAAYFKALTGQSKAEPHFGYVLPCKIKGYEHMHVVLGLNYQQLIFNPDLGAKLELSLKTLATHMAGTYQAIGSNIIHSAWYPQGDMQIATALGSLHKHPSLTCDIEGFSLNFWEAGIGTIAFAWNKHEGLAFACDYQPTILEDGRFHPECPLESSASHHGFKRPNRQVRRLLLDFFCSYQGELTFHHSTYDVKVIIFTLWMQDLLDRHGLLEGLEIMTRRMHDTKQIAYLATNSTAGNVLGLKSLAHEFAGNWAKEEINDIRRIPLPELLQYNLVDALSTFYVREKYEPIMERDGQGDLYRGLWKDSLVLIIQTELIGMPMSRKRIQEVKAELQEIQRGHLDTIQNNGVIQSLNLLLRDQSWEKDFEDRKAKAKNPHKIKEKDKAAFDHLTFNPNSGPQLQKLLYDMMGLPVIDFTDTKQPATGAETIEKLINHTTEPAYKALLEALIGYGKVTKILGTFIPAFEGAVSKDNSDTVWLHGCFNLGGTVSGRLSSSDPNLQNIPANSTYGKLIKTCFVGPTGWLFCGADFNSLEDYISALTTKDPNKLKVYIDGFDGHCLRACFYFREENEDLAKIDINDPKQVNVFKAKEHPLEPYRQESKAPTFLLTYGGTYHGMMSNLGWSEEKSKKIEKGYHELYKASDAYVQRRLEQASKDGYVEVAFGLRVRTPLLAQVIFNGARVPHEAKAEGRTAGNALGQSYGLLNNRAAAEFMKRVRASKYRYRIFPVALIHDAIYILVEDDIEVVEWANNNLIDCMRWQELSEIQHPTVKLGAALDIFWPSWAKATTLPNDADRDTIINICKATRDKVLEAA